MQTIITMTLNPAIDKSATVAQVIAERKLYCENPRFEAGGGGVNVARAIKKLGGTSLLLYPSGGLTGQKLQQLLDAEDLDHHSLQVEDVSRENLVVYEESTGQQYRFGMPGPTLSAEECKPFVQKIASIEPTPDFVVASGSLPPGAPVDFYAQVAQAAKERGAKVIVDTSGEALKAALYEGVFLLKPNIREFRELVGSEIKEESQIKDAARAIVASGKCEILVISLGAGGALVATADFMERILPPTVPIVSKVGAGDSMVAGIVLSLARGNPVRESLFFGIASGTAAVMTPGTELCRQEDAERLYADMISDS